MAAFGSEKKLIEFSHNSKIQYYILRYFNVCGASKSGNIGIMGNNKSLFKVLSNQSLKKNHKPAPIFQNT